MLPHTKTFRFNYGKVTNMKFFKKNVSFSQKSKIFTTKKMFK